MGSTSNKEDKKEIESAIYADDDLFVTKNEETLISIIETIYEWAEKYDMILNKKKSAIIRLTKRNDRRTKPLDKTEYFGIPVVNEYKYLGVILTNKAKLSTMIKKIKIKSLFVIGKLYNICKKGSVKFRLNMFKVIIDPLFSYIGVFKQYLNKYELKEVEQTWNCMAKKILGLAFNTKNVYIKWMIGKYSDIGDIETIRNKGKLLNWSGQDIEVKEATILNEIKAKEIKKELGIGGITKKWIKIVNYVGRWSFNGYRLKPESIGIKYLEVEWCFRLMINKSNFISRSRERIWLKNLEKLL